jgi:drug/metabolite transporter (DMT)-like permease
LQLFKFQSTTLSKKGLANLLVVYIVWSSTYLAIRVGMEASSGLSPLAMGTIRLLLAGMVLIGFAWFKGHKLRITKHELFILTITSILLWVVCNGLVMWAEQHANSGFAALILATSPIMVAWLNYMLLRHIPSRLLLGSLVFSFLGVGLLMVPSMLQGNSTQFYAGITLLFCALSWSGGTIFQAHNPIKLEVSVISGYQHLIGGIIFGLLMLLFQEPLPHPTLRAWAALSYLIIFGSVFAFTAFVTAVKLLPINIVMTYSYINPVFALFLGWWLLHEPITIWTLIDAAMVILGVIGVFQGRADPSRLQERKAAKVEGSKI